MKLKSYLLSLLVMFACSVLATSCEEDPIEEFGGAGFETEVSFDIRVGGMTSHGVNVEVLPSNDVATYYFGFLTAEEVKDMNQGQIQELVLSKGGDLLAARHYMTAEQMEIEAPLEAETSYHVYALGYDEVKQKVTSQLATKAFRTKKEKNPNPDVPSVTAPAVEFIGGVQEGNFFFGARCTSFDATAAYIGLFDGGAYEAMKADGITLETVFDRIEGYMDFAEQNGWLEMLNSEKGIALNAGPAKDGKSVEAFLKVTNGEGTTVRWADTKGATDGWDNSSEAPAPQPETPDAPVVDFIGGVQEGNFFFGARCNSMDAVAAYIGLFDAGAYEAMKADGITLETVFDNIEGYMDFAEQNGWLEMLNSEQGIGLNAGPAKEGDGVEAFLKVSNGDGITVKFADTKGAMDSWDNGGNGGGVAPQPGNGPQVDFLAGVHEGVVTFAMACLSQDATEAYFLIGDKASIDGIVAQGASLEEIVDGNMQAAAQFSKQGWLDAFNSKDGISLNNKELDVKEAWTGLLDARNDDGRTVKRADSDSGMITSPRPVKMMSSYKFPAVSYKAQALTLAA